MLAVVFTATASFAAIKEKPSEKSLGIFGAWHAYVSTEGGQTVCYMVTTKRIKSVSLQKRGTPYLMITHRPTEASRDVISYGAGALLDTKRGVHLSVGKNSFDLFSVRDTAWARDSLTDHKIAAAIRAASMAHLSAQESRKAKAKKNPPSIHDIFDLTGAPAAYHVIGKACGLPDETPVKSTPQKKKPAKTVHKKLRPKK